MVQIPVSKGTYRLLSGIGAVCGLLMLAKGGDNVGPGLLALVICGWAFLRTF
jgi:hypothetical protein